MCIRDRDDIDQLSRRVPCLCKVAPAKQDVHMEDVHRAGGIMAIFGQLDNAGLLNRDCPTVHAPTMGAALDHWDISRTNHQAVRDFFPVSYTHLDVYKRQQPAFLSPSGIA